MTDFSEDFQVEVHGGSAETLEVGPGTGDIKEDIDPTTLGEDITTQLLVDDASAFKESTEELILDQLSVVAEKMEYSPEGNLIEQNHALNHLLVAVSEAKSLADFEKALEMAQDLTQAQVVAYHQRADEIGEHPNGQQAEDLIDLNVNIEVYTAIQNHISSGLAAEQAHIEGVYTYNPNTAEFVKDLGHQTREELTETIEKLEELQGEIAVKLFEKQTEYPNVESELTKEQADELIELKWQLSDVSQQLGIAERAQTVFDERLETAQTFLDKEELPSDLVNTVVDHLYQSGAADAYDNYTDVIEAAENVLLSVAKGELIESSEENLIQTEDLLQNADVVAFTSQSLANATATEELTERYAWNADITYQQAEHDLNQVFQQADATELYADVNGLSIEEASARLNQADEALTEALLKAEQEELAKEALAAIQQQQAEAAAKQTDELEREVVEEAKGNPIVNALGRFAQGFVKQEAELTDAISNGTVKEAVGATAAYLFGRVGEGINAVLNPNSLNTNQAAAA